jgi:D-galactose 1-dehydrogenase
MNFGVIGGGRVLEHYLGACATSAHRIAAIYDSDLSGLSQLPSDVRAHATLDEMLVSRDLDAIVVSTPSATHFEIARKVIDAGRPVVIEKPVCLVAKEFETLRVLCAEKRVPAFIFMHATYGLELDPGIAVLRDLQAGTKHPHVSWHASFFDPYEADCAAQASLMNSWVDSGINAVSIILRVLPGAQLRQLAGSATPPKSEVATDSAVQCFKIEGEWCGMAVIETNWRQGVSHKSSRIVAGSGTLIDFQHSAECVTVTAGEAEIRTSFASEVPRMATHYRRAFEDAAAHLSAGRSNWEVAAAAHAAYFQGFPCRCG